MGFPYESGKSTTVCRQGMLGMNHNSAPVGGDGASVVVAGGGLEGVA